MYAPSHVKQQERSWRDSSNITVEAIVRLPNDLTFKVINLTFK